MRIVRKLTNKENYFRKHDKAYLNNFKKRQKRKDFKKGQYNFRKKLEKYENYIKCNTD